MQWSHRNHLNIEIDNTKLQQFNLKTVRKRGEKKGKQQQFWIENNFSDYKAGKKNMRFWISVFHVSIFFANNNFEMRKKKQKRQLSESRSFLFIYHFSLLLHYCRRDKKKNLGKLRLLKVT